MFGEKVRESFVGQILYVTHTITPDVTHTITPELHERVPGFVVECDQLARHGAPSPNVAQALLNDTRDTDDRMQRAG
ncbi:hypothetical protein ASC80_05285 [Afipia sp. Root123D2]|nr:hypothetical protein ASC80_05285 [Afipia sp. Root123D2]